MGLHAATALNRRVKSSAERAVYAGRFNIGPRLILGFVFIILSMLAADAVVLWQFHLVRTQAERLNGIDQKLVAVLRVHTSLLVFRDRLEELTDSQDIGRLVAEGGFLRTAVLEDTRRAMSALSLPPFDPQRDPTILPTLHVIQSALPTQLEAITTLATSGDWRAAHLRLANEVTPLESLTATLVENVDHQVGEEQTQTVRNIKRVQRLVFLVVPLTAVFTLLIAATLGVAITRSITQPLARLVEGSKALARGEFQHRVPVTGNDELAHLGRVFNDTALRLRDLYATLQSSEDRLRLVIDTIPAYAWSALPDGSVDFINRRFLEFTGRSNEDMLGWGWGSLVHPDDLTGYIGEWQAAVASGEPMEGEIRVRRMDGEYRWLLIRNMPLRDERGNIVNWYGTAIDIEERHRAEDALRRSETYLSEAQRLSHTGSFGWCVSTGEIKWSEETSRIFRYERSTKPTIELILQRVHPEDASSFKETVARASQDGKDFEHEYRLVMPDGAVKHVHVVAHAEREESGEIEFVGAVMDITERKLAEALRDEESRILEMIARDAPLEEILEKLVLAVEAQFAGLLCSVLLLDEDGQHVRHGAAPSLPKAYTKAIDGLCIGPNAGSCGTAMYRREPVVVTDILQDPLWELYREVAKPYGLRACWSVPILAHSGKALGSFAMYYREPRSPRPAETRALELATHLAGIAIERKLTHEQLQRSEAYLAEAQRLSHTGSWAFDTRGPVYWSEENFRIWGFDPQQGLPNRESVLQRIHPEDRGGVIEHVQKAVREGGDYVIEFRIVLPGGTVKHIQGLGHPVFSASGELTEVVGTQLDVTEHKRAEEERERLRQVQADLAHINRVTTMGELTASLAHEIKQPIAAAVTNAKTCLRWLGRDEPDVAEAREAASRLVKDAMRAV